MICEFLKYIDECEKEGKYAEKELGFNSYDFTYIRDCIRMLYDYKNVGIYGTGLHAERFIKVLLKYGLKDRICCFIDENISETNFFGFPLRNVVPKACEEFDLEIIIISSKIYEEKIYTRISSCMPENVNLYRIYNGKEKAEERVYFAEDDDFKVYKRFYLLPTYKAHLNRYGFALSYVRNKNVLDMVCGSGYGSYILAKEAEKVYSIDIADDAINFAKKYYSASNITFIKESIECLNLCDQVDVIVSFETIEHISSTDQYFKCICRNLKTDGIFIVSTPLALKDGQSISNRFHTNEFTHERFKRELNKYFSDIIYYRQEYDYAGSICIDDGTYRNAGPYTFAIAVCADMKI